MTTEQKFHAAVNVIRSLPKSGSYQPSHALMLTFYAYFKQATEGRCTKSKPGFWDIVNKAKWEAWNNLGDMKPERAMEAYVTELHKIVETMAYTDNVAAFFDTVENDVTVPKDDLLLVAGDVFEKAKSTPGTPANSPKTNGMTNGTDHLHNGHPPDSEDEYIDTVDSEDSDLPAHRGHENGFIPNGHGPQTASKHTTLYTTARAQDTNNRVLDELRKTVGSMEKDILLLKDRVNAMEKERANLEKSIMWARPAWWPQALKGVSPALLAALILWPVVANRLVAAVRSKKQ